MKFKSAALIVTGGMLLSLLVACGSDKDPAPAPAPAPLASLLASYKPAGPQVNVPATTATSGGWTVCHSELYNANTAALTTVLATCNKPGLMLACRPVGAANYQLLAAALRADVTFATAAANDGIAHNANGSGWYYNTGWSWGFALQGDVVDKDSCDVNGTGDVAKRLCWHTNGNIDGGYRCGIDVSLNGSTAFERHILHAD